MTIFVFSKKKCHIHALVRLFEVHNPMFHKTDSHIYRELSYLQITKLRKETEIN